MNIFIGLKKQCDEHCPMAMLALRQQSSSHEQFIYETEYLGKQCIPRSEPAGENFELPRPWP